MKVEVNLDKAKMKLSQGNVDKGRYALANQALADMNQYVPFHEGSLRMTATIDIDGRALNWDTPYAKAQFYGHYTNYTTPGTGRRWDEKAKGLHIKDWEKAYIKGSGL